MIKINIYKILSFFGVCDKPHHNNEYLFSKKPVSPYIRRQYQDILNKNYMISKTDTTGVITYVNELFLTTHGLKESDILGKTHNVIKSPNTPSEIYRDLWHIISNGIVWSGKVEYKGIGSSVKYALVKIYPIRNDDNVVVEYLAMREDITD